MHDGGVVPVASGGLLLQGRRGTVEITASDLQVDDGGKLAGVCRAVFGTNPELIAMSKDGAIKDIRDKGFKVGAANQNRPGARPSRRARADG
jgi:hypothetical protein